VRLLDELTRCALTRHTIAVIGDEPRLAYNRATACDIELKPMSEKQKSRKRKGRKGVRVDFPAYKRTWLGLALL
jgi:hypothetical protein